MHHSLVELKVYWKIFTVIQIIYIMYINLITSFSKNSILLLFLLMEDEDLYCFYFLNLIRELKLYLFI